MLAQPDDPSTQSAQQSLLATALQLAPLTHQQASAQLGSAELATRCSPKLRALAALTCTCCSAVHSWTPAARSGHGCQCPQVRGFAVHAAELCPAAVTAVPELGIKIGCRIATRMQHDIEGLRCGPGAKRRPRGLRACLAEQSQHPSSSHARARLQLGSLWQTIPR